MKATLESQDNKFVVKDPRNGGSIAGTFEAAQVLEAVALRDAINEQLTAATGPQIQILSLDGGLIAGIRTIKATDKVVYTQKPTATNKLKADVDKTERDLCELTGYVICSRNPNGKVRSEWSGADFPKDVKMTVAGLLALRTALAGDAA